MQHPFFSIKTGKMAIMVEQNKLFNNLKKNQNDI